MVLLRGVRDERQVAGPLDRLRQRPLMLGAGVCLPTRVDPAAIKRVALFTIEGEHDDISGVGQTEAAHRLCINIPPDRQAHWLQPGVGHYGVFNGSRFRSEIAPRISDFVLSMTLSDRTARRALSARLSDNGAALRTA